MTVTVRPLEPTDEVAWRDLWAGYLAFYDTAVDEAVYVSSFARLLGDDPRDFNGLVAEASDGRLVGLSHFLFHRHGWKITDVCYLQDVYVDPDWRRRGIASDLIEGVYAVADAAGAPDVYWLTQDFNTSARRLYDRIGTLTPFVKYART